MMKIKNREPMTTNGYVKSLSDEQLKKLKYNDNHGLIDWDRATHKATPSIDFVLPGLPLGVVGSIVASGGTGKGYVSFELCLGISVSKDLLELGIKNTGDNVLYLSAEDNQTILEHRVASLIDHLDDNELLVAKKHIAIQSISGFADLKLIDQNGNKVDEWVNRLEKACSTRRLVIIDTLRRFHRAEENDSGAMSYLIAILEEIAHKTKCSILFTHHLSKAGTSRGSTVLHANIRWQLYLENMTTKEAENLGVDNDCTHKFVKINSEFSKLNYDKKRGDIWLRRVEGGILIPAVFDSKKDINKKKKEEKKEKQEELAESADDFF